MTNTQDGAGSRPSYAERLSLLDLIRVASDRFAKYQTAVRASGRASAAAAAAGEDYEELARRSRRIAASCTEAQREAAARALLAASTVYEAAREMELRAAAKRVRALRAVPAASRAWRERMAELGRSRSDDRGSVARQLLEEFADDPVELSRAADAIVFWSSGGKDSVVALSRTIAAAEEAGCLEKVVVVHCDLGQAEWPGVRDLARRQAERYGVKFLAVETDGGFLGFVEQRGMWPDAKRRLCTSKLKRDKNGPVITAIVAALGLKRQAVVLNVMGVRAGESSSRALKSRLAIDPRLSTSRRMVLTWNAVFELSETAVWQEIADQKLEYHPCYDARLERLSCVYCVLAGTDWLVLATRVCFALGLPHPQIYADLERRIDHSFKDKITLGGVIAAARMLDALESPVSWQRGDAIRRHLGDAAADSYLAATSSKNGAADSEDFTAAA